MRAHRQVLFMLVLAWASAGMAAGPGFTKDIKCQQDWVDRLKETWDARILYLLSNRAGVTLSQEKCVELCQELKQKPDTLEAELKEAGILRDVEAYLKETETAWQTKYAAEAVILNTDEYLILGCKSDDLLLKCLKKYMTKIIARYRGKFDTKEKIEGRFLIQIYPDRGDFLATGAPQFAAAYFSPRARALVGFAPREQTQNLNWIMSTVIHTFFHEGWHQYFHYYVPQPPPWLDEGIAEMNEATIVKGDELAGKEFVNVNDARAAVQISNQKKFTPLERFTYLSLEEFYTNPQVHYPQAWAFVHFLVSGKTRYKKNYNQLMKDLQNAEDTKTALDKAFAGVKWDHMEEEFKAYVKQIDIPAHSQHFTE